MRLRKMTGPTASVFGMLVLLLAAVIAHPRTASAQQTGSWSVDARGGLAIPAGDLSEFEDLGGNAEIGVAYWVHPRLALRVDGGVDILSGKDASDTGILVPQVPDMTLFHYVGGVEFRVTPPEGTRWDVTVNVEAGATTIDTDDDPAFTTGPGSNADFTKTYFTGNGGLRIGYQVSPRFAVFAGGQAYLIAADEQETQVFTAFSSDVDPSGFSTAWTFPVQVGARVTF